MIFQFKRNIRTRIYLSLKKDKHTVEYLGCTIPEYLNWLLKYDTNYTLENRGYEWHIDHVIPLSRFNLENEEQQLIAFNWRNTMPLSCSENLSKNNKIMNPTTNIVGTKLECACSISFDEQYFSYFSIVSGKI